MAYIEGLPLQHAVTNEGLDQREVVEIFVKVCDAVDYAHSRGILHHDIKPQNILLDSNHDPVLIDFGISGKLGEVDESNQIVGSPAYLPPEYISGTGSYDVPGEVYALGATLYSVLAGRPPHDGIDTRRLLKAASREPVTHLRSVRRTVHPELARIVMTALNFDPQRRYTKPRDFANDLRRWLEGDEVVAGQGPLLRAWSRVRGKVAATFGLVLALLLVTITATYQLALSQQKKAGVGQADQFERERSALHTQVVQARLESARLLLEMGKGPDAEKALDRLLEQYKAPTITSKLLAEIHGLRAKVREQLGDTAGAADDREAAKRLKR
jgi:serine/threonine-protein kinase